MNENYLRGLLEQKPHRGSRELLCKTEEEFKETIKLLYADDAITDLNGRHIDHFFPDVAGEMKIGYDRGHWVSEHLPEERLEENERTLARVTLYQLQTALHRDRGDKLCATTCVGRFKGGEGIFPDLKAKLA